MILKAVYCFPFFRGTLINMIKFRFINLNQKYFTSYHNMLEEVMSTREREMKSNL